MNHRLTQIALAVAALGLAPTASALTPPQINAGGTVYTWLSGASAPTSAVFQSAVSLCAGIKYKDANGVTHTNPGTNDVDIYLQSGTAGALPGSAGDHLIYSCTVQTFDNRAGSLENQKVVVYHTVAGGSFNSYSPHLVIAGESNPNITNTLTRLQNITGTTPNQANSCSVARSIEAVAISGELNNIGIFRGCTTQTVTFTPGQNPRTAATQQPDRPDGGFSDTEYPVNKELLGIGRDEGDIGFPTATNVAQLFGVGVSYPLYYQLQQNDIAAGRLPNNGSCNGSASAPNLTAACQPTLATQQYSTIAADSSIDGVDGTLFDAVPTPPGTSQKITLQRRVPTSGTQSASEIGFLHNPCSTGPLLGALTSARGSATGVTRNLVVVKEHASTGGVKTGLTTASNAGEFSLGFLSLENLPSGTEKWAFVKLDKVSPNSDPDHRVNGMVGLYRAWYELVAFTAGVALPEGVDLVSSLAGGLSNPQVSNLRGLFVTPLAGFLPSDPPTSGNIGRGYREGNSCRPALHVGPPQ